MQSLGASLDIYQILIGLRELEFRLPHLLSLAVHLTLRVFFLNHPDPLKVIGWGGGWVAHKILETAKVLGLLWDSGFGLRLANRQIVRPEMVEKMGL